MLHHHLSRRFSLSDFCLFRLRFPRLCNTDGDTRKRKPPMPPTPYLLHRGRRHDFRMRVPSDLVQFFCRRYIVASLHTARRRNQVVDD